MNINRHKQYNQGVGKYKVLSSNAGVGSIIATKAGFFIMPQSTSFWGFVDSVNKQIALSNTTPEDVAIRAGVDIIDDPRFVDFLKREQQIENLKLLVDVPHLSLSDYNIPDKKSHPLYKKHYEQNRSELPDDHFTIPAIHFPRWFYSRSTNCLKSIEEWKKLWKEKRCNNGDLEYFAPPRDPFKKTGRKFGDKDVYDLLVQVPMLLICKNGHISDIPWYQLFCAGIEGKKKEMTNKDGFDLFNYECRECDSGGKHNLQWIENRSSSESWGVIKCSKCGKTFSLEGIMNIRPFCNGDMPWNGLNEKASSFCLDAIGGKRSTMQMALVTSNSVYYADSFSSLYIPSEYLPDTVLSSTQQTVYDLLQNKWYKKIKDTNPEMSPIEFWDSIDIIDKADDAGITIGSSDADLIKKKFVVKIDDVDTYEEYRFEEYKIFSGRNKSLESSNKLEFYDIEVPSNLHNYFSKIQQIPSLAITITQLGFHRVALPTPKRINGKVTREPGQPIYKESIDQVATLPANQTMGEGLFFEFNMDMVNEWVDKYSDIFVKRYNQPAGDLGKALKEEIDQYGPAQFYLLHTFSHIILKELEFSCGYPTASLQERLYYSDRMCGVLIYTTDGSEGSMGGLVWQGQPHLINRIIQSALQRAQECSSDPLCWENEENLNLAACFSCGLVSETSCEKRNLGLDRRALIDMEFGYFKNL